MVVAILNRCTSVVKFFERAPDPQMNLEFNKIDFEHMFDSWNEYFRWADSKSKCC